MRWKTYLTSVLNSGQCLALKSVFLSFPSAEEDFDVEGTETYGEAAIEVEDKLRELIREVEVACRTHLIAFHLLLGNNWLP